MASQQPPSEREVPTDRRYLFPPAPVHDKGPIAITKRAFLTYAAAIFSVAVVGEPQLWIGQRPIASAKKAWHGLLAAFGKSVPP